MQVFNKLFEILFAPTEPKNLILLNFPKKAYHAPPPPPPHSEGYSPMISCAAASYFKLFCNCGPAARCAASAVSQHSTDTDRHWFSEKQSKQLCSRAETQTVWEGGWLPDMRE